MTFTAHSPLRLAVVRDFREEGWPSMDLVADMLLDHLGTAPQIAAAEEIAPPFRRILSAIPGLARLQLSRNFDRLWNRFITLRRAVRGARDRCDAFHIVDHSHAHLVHALPSERTGVYCHDLDTFRCLLMPDQEPRSFWFRVMARRTLTGLQRAAIVFHNSRGTGDELCRWKLIEPERLRLVPLGVAQAFTPDPSAPQGRRAAKAFGLETTSYLLHIGSCIPRKRIDFLFQLFAEVRRARPELLLVKVGDPWTDAQAREIEQLGIGSSIRHLGRLPQARLVDAIRGAASVVIPSDSEGFGLPVVEALACGVPVVASDIATLREAGGDVARYAPVGDLSRWVSTVEAAIAATDDPTERRLRREWTAQFSWERYARSLAEAYRELLAGRSLPNAEAGSRST